MADGYIREANTGIGMVHEGVGDAGWMLRQLGMVLVCLSHCSVVR
jgi:hypothetical protein